MSILGIVLIIVALGVGGIGGFYGYKRSLTEKALQFKERMAKVKEIEEEMLEDAKKRAAKVLELAEEKAQKIEAQ
jgi:uncharacterized protein YneF (UPF0154 family)